MRLLHTRDRRLQDFFDSPTIPQYAILSHTWGDDEVLLEHIRSGKAAKRKAYTKLVGACAQALRDGYEWIWIDTCCIDKTSSAELQEAINSMYRWYLKADICYVFLADVPSRAAGWDARFQQSRWWSRGWTLRTYFFLNPPVLSSPYPLCRFVFANEG